MFAKSVLRAASTRAALRVTPAVSNKATRATFVAFTKKSGADPLIPQSEVPLSSYADGEVQRTTVTVGSSAEAAVPEVEKVTPLSRAVYNTLPVNMQKMTLMDKVVIVTG